LAPFGDPEVALVYGKQRGNQKTKYSEHRVFAKWFPESSDWDQSHPFCNNANAAIRRSLWKGLPYDETLTGLEDLDWAVRAMDRGYKIAYAADATVIHVHDESPRAIHNRYRREAIALKRIFPEQRFTLWDLLRLLPANVVSDFYHGWHDGELRENLQEIVLFRLMQFAGTYRGFRQRGPVADHLKRTFYYPNNFRRPAREKPEPSRCIDYGALSSEDPTDAGS
jgi:hypothetical protein